MFEDVLKTNNPDGIKFICGIIDSWEGVSKIPYKLGISIDHFVEDPALTVMIHRTRLDIDGNINNVPIDDTLNSIMEKGLINYGDINAVGGSAFSKEIPSLTKTMTPLEGLSGYINLISSYKDNDTIVFAGFPSNLVDKEGEIIGKPEDVYNFDTGHPAVKQEYMMGAIIKDKQGNCRFYTRDEILNANSQNRISR